MESKRYYCPVSVLVCDGCRKQDADPTGTYTSVVDGVVVEKTQNYQIILEACSMVRDVDPN